MTSTITTLLPKITSIQSQISSIDAALATATVPAKIAQMSKLEQKLSLSLSILVNQEFIATATSTATSQLAAATSNLAAAQASLTVLIEADNLYGMHPSFAGNLALAVVMGLLLLAHGGLGWWYRTWYFGIAYCIGAVLELIGYIGRTLSAHNIDDTIVFIIQSACLTFAPCFTMAGVYFLLCQLIVVFGPQYALLRPMFYSYIFITCDVVSLGIQAAGGGIANSGNESAKTGTNIMVAGLIFQVVSMSIFMFLFLHFLHKVRYFRPSQYHQMEEDGHFESQFKDIRKGRFFRVFPIVIILAVIFVYIRCFYRVVELAEGWGGYLMVHEPFFLVLEGMMMALAYLVFVIFHPGFVFGKNAVRVSGSKKKTSIEKKEYEMCESVTEVDESNPFRTDNSKVWTQV